MPSATPGWRRDPLSRTLAATGAVVVTLAMLALFARPSWHAPGPSGASVRVTTPTISCAEAASAWSDGTAGAGVPAKTMRMEIPRRVSGCAD